MNQTIPTIPAQHPFTVPRAVMTIVVGTIASDHDVTRAELDFLRTICARSPLFAANDSAEDDDLIRFAADVLRFEGPAAVARAGRSLSPELREAAYLLACDAVLADGVITAAEAEHLEALGRTLDLPATSAHAIRHATVIRQRALGKATGG
jgi:hypothetical protein